MPTIRLLVLLLAATHAFSQKLDTAFLSAAKAQAATHYKEIMSGRTLLFSGTEYLPGPAIRDRHPFFGANEWYAGSVTYHNYRYDGIPLRYDIAIDGLVTENRQGQLIVLTREFVNEFSIGAHAFRSYSPDKHTLPVSGYYEVLYDGQTTVVARHNKSPENRIESGRVVIDYRERTDYFLRKEGRFFLITNKSSLLRILSDRKGELKQFIRKNRLYFNRRNRETFIERVAAQYDTLLHPTK